MGQKSIIVNTPNKKNHSDAQDWAAIFNGLYGGSTGILPIGSKLVVGVNEEFVIINDGVFSLDGHMLRVKEGTKQFLKIPETEVGKKRIAYVVAQYVVNTKLEDDTLEFAILAGEQDAINPLPPQVTIGNIDRGDRLNQSIIAELLIDGKKAEVNRYGKKAIILPSLVGEGLDEQEFIKFRKDHEISPDDYQGTDFQKVQKAIDEAVKKGYGIRFNRIYDITGNTIVINKNYQETREPTALIGSGGGIMKKDSGFMFTAKDSDTGDIYTTNMRFYGNRKDTTVWDGNKIIRLNSLNDYFHRIKVFSAKDRYAQSIKMMNFTVVYNDGWAFEWKNSFDVILQGMIEHGDNGIRNTRYDNNPDNFAVKLDCCIEGMTGTAISLGSCGATTISGYQEANGDYLILNNSDNYHTGLTVERCVLDPTKEQRDQNKKCIKWGNVGNGGAFSYSNYSTGDLHEVRNMFGKSTGAVNSIADQANGIMASEEGSPKEKYVYGFRDLNQENKIKGALKGLTDNAWQVGVSKSNMYGWGYNKNITDLKMESLTSTPYYGGFKYTSKPDYYNFLYKRIPLNLGIGKELLVKVIMRMSSGSGGMSVGYNFDSFEPSNLTSLDDNVTTGNFIEKEYVIQVPKGAKYINIGLVGGGQSYSMEVVGFDVWVNQRSADGYGMLDPQFSL